MQYNFNNFVNVAGFAYFWLYILFIILFLDLLFFFPAKELVGKVSKVSKQVPCYSFPNKKDFNLKYERQTEGVILLAHFQITKLARAEQLSMRGFRI